LWVSLQADIRAAVFIDLRGQEERGTNSVEEPNTTYTNNRHALFVHIAGCDYSALEGVLIEVNQLLDVIEQRIGELKLS
jgi:hypothetical protein